MIFQYYLVYIVVNVVCLAFAFVVLTRLTSSVGSEQENRLFRMMLVMYMAFLVCEIVWAFGVGNILPVSPHATSVIKLVGTIFIPVMVYFWLQYAEIGFGNSLAHTKKFKMITFIPAGIMLLVYLSNPATGLIATIQPDGTIINGPMRALTGLIDNIYGIAVIVHAVILLVRNRNPLQTRTYVTHIMFIVICTIGGIADAAISNTPIMPLAILLSYTVLFINLQESKIFNDSVTGLHNRRMADNYIRDSIEDASEKNPLCLLMMDIDDFKSINDRFGHQEGDRALRITSGCLKKVVTKWNGFLSRWGGDEFMVMLNVGDNDKVGSFMNEVKKELDLAARDESLPYGLGVSMGMEFCRSRDMEPAQLINAADSRLYEVKAARGIEKGEWIRL